MPLSPQDREALRMTLNSDLPREERARKIDELYLGPEIVEKPGPPEGRLAQSERDVIQSEIQRSMGPSQDGEQYVMPGSVETAPQKRYVPVERAKPPPPKSSMASEGGDEVTARASAQGLRGVPLSELYGGPEPTESAPQKARRAAAAPKTKAKPKTVKTEIDEDVRGALRDDVDVDQEYVDPDLAGALSEYSGEVAEEGQTIEEMSREPDEEPDDGLVTAQRTVTRSEYEPSRLERGELEESTEQLYGASQDLTDAELEARERERGIRRISETRKQNIERKFLEKQDERLKQYDREIEKYRNLAKEVASTDITDPSIYTGDIGTDVLRGIGAFLLGLGSGYEPIRDMLNRNLEVQKANLAKKERSLVARESLLGQLRDRFDNEAQQDAAFRALQIQNVISETENLVSKAKDPVVKARGEQLLAEQRRELALEEAQFNQATAGKETVTEVLPEPQLVGGGGSGVPPELQAILAATEEREAKNKLLEAHGYKPELYLPDAATTAQDGSVVGAYAMSEDDVKKLKDMGAAKKDVVSGLRRLKELTDNVLGGQIKGTKAAAQAKAIHKDLMTAINSARSLGALDNGTVELLSKMIPEPGLFSASEIAAYDEMLTRTNQSFRNQLESRGVRYGPPPDKLLDYGKPQGEVVK